MLDRVFSERDGLLTDRELDSLSKDSVLHPSRRPSGEAGPLHAQRYVTNFIFIVSIQLAIINPPFLSVASCFITSLSPRHALFFFLPTSRVAYPLVFSLVF